MFRITSQPNSFLQTCLKTSVVLGSMFLATQSVQAQSDTTASIDPTQKMVSVTMDHAKLLPMSHKITKVIVGNPTIAGVTLYDERTLLLTGKSFGRTNMIVLGEGGVTLYKSILGVKANGLNTVVIHRGTTSASYDCAERCNPKIAVGDDKGHTESTMESVQGRIKFVKQLSK